MKELERNNDGSVATVVDMANKMIVYLKDQELISENMAKHMSYKSMCNYTHEYFVKNIGILAAMNKVPEEKWKSIEAELLDSKYDMIFKKGDSNQDEQ